MLSTEEASSTNSVARSSPMWGPIMCHTQMLILQFDDIVVRTAKDEEPASHVYTRNVKLAGMPSAFAFDVMQICARKCLSILR